jgi:hypothetical protein
MTLLHELGHHVSSEELKPRIGPGKGLPKRLEEARADRYAMWHWRADPRILRRGQDIDPSSATYIGRQGEFAPYKLEDFYGGGLPGTFVQGQPRRVRPEGLRSKQMEKARQEFLARQQGQGPQHKQRPFLQSLGWNV